MTNAAFAVILISAGGMIGACSSSPASPGQANGDSTSASFVNKVWRVSESPAVAIGTLEPQPWWSAGDSTRSSGRRTVI